MDDGDKRTTESAEWKLNNNQIKRHSDTWKREA